MASYRNIGYRKHSWMLSKLTEEKFEPGSENFQAQMALQDSSSILSIISVFTSFPDRKR